MKNLPITRMYHFNEIPEGTTKHELFQELIDKNICFDYSLPQNWLDSFVDTSNLDYSLVTFTTVYIYDESNYFGYPCSCCHEVQDKLNELYTI